MKHVILELCLVETIIVSYSGYLHFQYNIVASLDTTALLLRKILLLTSSKISLYKGMVKTYLEILIQSSLCIIITLITMQSYNTCRVSCFTYNKHLNCNLPVFEYFWLTRFTFRVTFSNVVPQFLHKLFQFYYQFC